MKAASISDIKQELLNLSPKEVLEHCLKLARFKKENKELLSYLLFDAHNQEGYIETIKIEIRESFAEMRSLNQYFTKKSLRKILRSVARFSKQMNSRQADAEMLIFFCHQFKEKGLHLNSSAALANLYNQQLKKLKNLVEALHEDLHFDYMKQLDEL